MSATAVGDYCIEPRKAALVDLELLDLPGRNPLLPPIYRYIGKHPQRRHLTSTSSSTYVYLVDPSPQGKKYAKKLAKELKIPYGRLATMNVVDPGESCWRPLTGTASHQLSGLLELVDGDWFMARDAYGEGDAMKDVLQAFIGDP